MAAHSVANAPMVIHALVARFSILRANKNHSSPIRVVILEPFPLFFIGDRCKHGWANPHRLNCWKFVYGLRHLRH